jgi:dienelactone hydrolase
MAATDATSRGPGDALDVTVDAEVDGEVVATATLARYATDPGVVETEIQDDGLVAVFVTPGTPGPHPALLAFGGSEGGIDWARRAARHYASLGYSCLGLAYFGAPGLPQHLEDVPLEYFGGALAWMKQRPEVKADAIGVVGASRGGELALILGATFPEVKAVVAHVPSGVVWPGEGPAGAWTLAGQELSYVPGDGFEPVVTVDDEGRRVEYGTPMFMAALDAASPAALDAATTRVEKTQGPVLLLASADDQLWPSCRLAGIAMDRLTQTGHAAAFADDLVCYPAAGHILGDPGLPTTGRPFVTLPDHTVLAIGGTPAGTARAAREAFERRRAFLAKALRP